MRARIVNKHARSSSALLKNYLPLVQVFAFVRALAVVITIAYVIRGIDSFRFLALAIAFDGEHVEVDPKELADETRASTKARTANKG